MKSKFLLFLSVTLLLGFSRTFATARNNLVGVVIHGKVLDAKTLQPVSGSVSIYRDSDVFKERSDLEYGEFSETLTDYGWYLITISAKGYVEVTDTLWVMNDQRTDVNRDYYLTSQTVSSTRLDNIYFDLNKSTWSTASGKELEGVVKFLQENPDMLCEIGGHADRSGPLDYNKALSQKRADAVVDFLAMNGIDRNRLKVQAYGASIPLVNSETREALAKNRRVEITPITTNQNRATDVAFSNIFFDFAKASLSEHAYPELQQVIKFLNDNPTATCEISGHADKTGIASYNVILSQSRAQAAMDYLVSRGIDKARLKARGYGASKPLDSNATGVGRAKNRRVEFTIVANAINSNS